MLPRMGEECNCNKGIMRLDPENKIHWNYCEKKADENIATKVKDFKKVLHLLAQETLP